MNSHFMIVLLFTQYLFAPPALAARKPPTFNLNCDAQLLPNQDVTEVLLKYGPILMQLRGLQDVHIRGKTIAIKIAPAAFEAIQSLAHVNFEIQGVQIRLHKIPYPSPISKDPKSVIDPAPFGAIYLAMDLREFFARFLTTEVGVYAIGHEVVIMVEEPWRVSQLFDQPRSLDGYDIYFDKFPTRD